MPALELPFYENKVLFGYDSTPGLVAFEREGEAAVRVFSRHGERTESSVYQGLTPFLLLADPALLKAWSGAYELETLAGEGLYSSLVSFASWSDLEKARTYLQRLSSKPASIIEAPYVFLNDPVAQHLMLSG
ncbi:MAG: hypothetical protein ACREOH_21980, partial [Candidatus Entotheonellia bacterium]